MGGGNSILKHQEYLFVIRQARGSRQLESVQEITFLKIE